MIIKKLVGELKTEANEKYVKEIQDYKDAIDDLNELMVKKQEEFCEYLKKFYTEIGDKEFSFNLDKNEIKIFETLGERLKYENLERLKEHFRAKKK